MPCRAHFGSRYVPTIGCSREVAADVVSLQLVCTQDFDKVVGNCQGIFRSEIIDYFIVYQRERQYSQFTALDHITDQQHKPVPTET